MSPYVTSRRLGGVDAFWYANMVRGVTDQIAAGHFPVPVGEGPAAWNGGVHPFRSAPVYPFLAIVWDVITFGRLGEFTLQHLIAITSALVGTLGFYVGAAKIMPRRRWAALAFAFLYLSVPSWLAVLAAVEDYMSYMAFAAMPLVLYGNARSVMESDGRGYVPLGAGLAIVWMCHPPIAFLASMATLFIQVGAAVGRGFAPWRGLVTCAAAFAVLSAYYFVSMSELPRAMGDRQMAVDICAILGLALFFVGVGRCALRPRNPAWAACALLGGILVGIGSRPWLIWISVSTAFWIVAAVACRLTKTVDFARHAFAILFLCALLGAAAAQVMTGPSHVGAYQNALGFLATNTSYLAGLLRPLPTPFGGLPLLQLGWSLDLAIVLGVLSLFGARPAGAKIFFAVSIGLVICFVRVPLVSDFLIGYFPISLSAMCGLPLALRITPVIASFAAMSGVLWLATLPSSGRWLAPAMGALAVLVAWSGYQASRFVVGGFSIRSSEAQTETSIRPEDLALSRYAYDLMHLPAYYTNGMTDPRLESRLLDDSGSIIIGPDQTARILEARGVRRVRLVCEPIPDSNWFNIVPAITVEPGEHLLLRFEFDPNHTYNGYMIMPAEDAYREYHLPDSGLDKAFGIGGLRTSVLSLWNSCKTAEHYRLSVSREHGNDLKVDGGLFADLSISELDPKALPIRLDSFIPYRASVSTKTGGWLETFVLYLPGYRALLDGSPVPVAQSSEALAEVRVPPGDHSIELRFVGTRRLWLAASLSAAGWMALCVLWIRRAGLRPVRRWPEVHVTGH